MGRRLPLLLAAAFALSACGSAVRPSPTRGVLTEGRRVFVASGCGVCHTLSAVGARGSLGPNFDTSEKLSRAQIESQLNAGVGGMPSYRGRLNPRQQAAVASFLFAEMHRRR